MILYLVKINRIKLDLSRVCGGDPAVYGYDKFTEKFVPRMRG